MTPPLWRIAADHRCQQTTHPLCAALSLFGNQALYDKYDALKTSDGA
jgi:hypothetical protein